jgi:hypothetical protein
MRVITVPLPAGVTDASPVVSPTSVVNDRLIQIPENTLPSGDTPPSRLSGSLEGAAAATVAFYQRTDAGGSVRWTLVSTLTIAAASTLTPAVPNTAGAPSVYPGPLYARITAAAATAAVLDLFLAP